VLWVNNQSNQIVLAAPTKSAGDNTKLKIENLENPSAIEVLDYGL